MLHPRHHHKLYDSPYFSLHKTGRLPPIDFAEGREEDVNKALELRSFKNEIIILVFTRHSVRWMVHYARMCQARRNSGARREHLRFSGVVSAASFP